MLNSGLRWSWIALLVLLVDRMTKEWAQRDLIPYTELPVLPGFNLTLSYNKGAAFNFLDQAAGWQVWFFGLVAVVVSIVIFVLLLRLPWRQYWTSIAFCFVLGGALGNLVDRLLYGQVIDFIQLYVSHFYWPTFNLADSAICIGAAMLVLQALRKKPQV